MNKEKDLVFLGLMSGTSLDGLDMALCSFRENAKGNGYQYKIIKTETLAYSAEMKALLLAAYRDPALSYWKNTNNMATGWANRLNCF